MASGGCLGPGLCDFALCEETLDVMRREWAGLDSFEDMLCRYARHFAHDAGGPKTNPFSCQPEHWWLNKWVITCTGTCPSAFARIGFLVFTNANWYSRHWYEINASVFVLCRPNRAWMLPKGSVALPVREYVREFHDLLEQWGVTCYGVANRRGLWSALNGGVRAERLLRRVMCRRWDDLYLNGVTAKSRQYLELSYEQFSLVTGVKACSDVEASSSSTSTVP